MREKSSSAAARPSSAGSYAITDTGIGSKSGSFIATWNVQMAGALIAATPTLVIFIVLGRYFVRGLLAGSLKG